MSDDLITRLVLEHMPDTWAIYRFGSSGSPEEHTGSDVDVALLFAPGKRDLFELAGILTDALHKTVDLVDLRRANTILQKEVVMSGRRILAQRELDADLFEVRVMGDYQKLIQERREIVEDGLRTGRFYGG